MHRLNVNALFIYSDFAAFSALNMTFLLILGDRVESEFYQFRMDFGIVQWHQKQVYD